MICEGLIGYVPTTVEKMDGMVTHGFCGTRCRMLMDMSLGLEEIRLTELQVERV